MPAIELSRRREIEDQNTPLAFNLQLEWDQINAPFKTGVLKTRQEESRKKTFLDNAQKYAGEYFGKVPTANYAYKVKSFPDGTLALVDIRDRYDVSIKERYRLAISTAENEVEKKRRGIEYLTFCRLEKMLLEAETDEIFVWPSPPPAEKIAGYGLYSFLFAFSKRENPSRNEKLILGQAIRHYLDCQGQSQLLHRLTDRTTFSYKPQVNELLETVVEVDNSKAPSIKDIRELVNQIYEETPWERKIIPQDERGKEEEQMEKILAELNPWLEGIYWLIKFKADKDLIVRNFHGWENAARDRVAGIEVDLSEFYNVSPEDWARIKITPQRSVFIRGEEFIQPPFYVSDIYAARLAQHIGGSCGRGSGFGSTSLIANLVNTTFGEASWDSANSSSEKEKYVTCCKIKVKKGEICPICGKQC